MRLASRSVATVLAATALLGSLAAETLAFAPVAAASAGPADMPASRPEHPRAARILLTASTGPAGVVAAAAELVASGTGRALWSRNLNAERPIASITKVMTALVVLKADGTKKIKVTAAAEAYGQSFGPSSAGLRPGDILTTRQLLEALLVPSGDDAAYLLAGAYGPGRPAFVRKMNAMARKLGMTRTHFANFDGLPWPTEHSTYSTAHDLMKLAAAAMHFAAFRQIVAQRTYVIAATKQHHRYDWTNTDLLLARYRGAIGIKTGFTLGAGYCLLFVARRGTEELTGVVLGSTTTNPDLRFTSAANLLNWGFAVTTIEDAARPKAQSLVPR